MVDNILHKLKDVTGMTNADLSRELDVNERTIRRLLGGSKRISPWIEEAAQKLMQKKGKVDRDFIHT